MSDRTYIPTTIPEERGWINNFAAVFATIYASLGFTDADNNSIQDQNLVYNYDYDQSQTADSRSPVTIATFATTRASTLLIFRDYAQKANNTAACTDGQRAALQITIRKTTKTDISAPLTWPVLTILAAYPLQHKIVYRDSSAPTEKVKAKPFGATACALYQFVSATPPADPSDALFIGLFTKGPFMVDLDASKVGQTAYYYAKWVTARGLEGPMVGPVSMTVAA